MILLLLLKFGFIFSTQAYTKDMDIGYLRNNYEHAVNDKNLCKNMIQQLEQQPLNATALAYLGGLQTIWAKHAFNPLSKLNTFHKGRANIEKAVSSDRNNIEIRFIRFSVQQNCPSFLGYKDALKVDERFLRANIGKLEAGKLKQLISNTLIN